MRAVFVDVDTQLDFLTPAGALYAPGAEKLTPVLGRLTQFALAQGIPILSTADAHAEDDAEFATWKPHCVAGTQGQQKIQATLTGKAVVLSAETPVGVPQVIVEKQTIDAFTNPYLTGLIRGLDAERYVVYGLVTEVCVRTTINGLLGLGKRVQLVTDAVKGFDREAAGKALDEFRAAGVEFVESDAVLRPD